MSALALASSIVIPSKVLDNTFIVPRRVTSSLEHIVLPPFFANLVQYPVSLKQPTLFLLLVRSIIDTASLHETLRVCRIMTDFGGLGLTAQTFFPSLSASNSALPKSCASCKLFCCRSQAIFYPVTYPHTFWPRLHRQFWIEDFFS